MTALERINALIAKLEEDGFGSELTTSLRELLAEIAAIIDGKAAPAP